MDIQGQVGPQLAGDGTKPTIRLGRSGEQIVSQFMGRYSEAAARKQIFSVCNQTGVTHSAALTTTFVGICVGNPVTSTVNLHLLYFGWTQLIVLGGPATVGIMTGLGSITGALTPRNGFVSGPAGQGLATGGATIPGTPVLERVFSTQGALATASWPPAGPFFIDLAGSIVLPPNTFAASYMSVASGASGFQGFFTWMEVPIIG